MSYIKKHFPDGTPVWKLYNDANNIEAYPSWQEVLANMLELGILPTLLVFEKVTPANCKDDMADKISASELY